MLITSNSLATATPERLPTDSTAAASVAVRFWRSPWIKVVSCPNALSIESVPVGACRRNDINILLVNRKAWKRALLPVEKQRHVRLAVGQEASQVTAERNHLGNPHLLCLAYKLLARHTHLTASSHTKRSTSCSNSLLRAA